MRTNEDWESDFDFCKKEFDKNYPALKDKSIVIENLLPADYLRPTPSFTLKHVEEEGIEGSVEFQFMATTQKAVTQDINVHYSVTCDGIDADKINLSAKNLLIKAGSTASEPITLSIQTGSIWKIPKKRLSIL